MESKNSIKNTKFKDKLWKDKLLGDKRKLRYYKKVIKPILDNHYGLTVLSSNKKKVNIAKIRNNFHELQSETRWWSITKTRWNDRICQICDSRQVEDEKNFLFRLPDSYPLSLSIP